MDNFNLPRKLTDAELTTIKTNIAANKAIFETAGWFIPVPDGRDVSGLGDKGVAYVDDALQVLEQNQSELGGVIDLAAFKAADDTHDQAQELEDLQLENLVAPHNVSLLAGAASKKYADNEYSVLKGMERMNTKWVAIVERLSARYKQGARTPKPPK